MSTPDRVKIADIARAAGVSPPTVSKVLNGRSEVAPETRERVQSALREHNYQRRPSGKQPRAGLVDLVIKELATPWSVEIIRGAEDACREAGIGLVVSAVHGAQIDTQRWLDNLAGRHSDGVLLAVSDLEPADRERLDALGVPLVFIDPIGDPDPNIPSIGSTNWAGGLAATEHLVNLGHRRIAMIAGIPTLLCTQARLGGYRTALERGGITPDPDLLRFGDHFPPSGYAAALELLDLPEPPTAIFAGTDLQAFGAYKALQSRGVRIPDDVSIVGFDDLAACDWVTPSLTSVRQRLVDMARMAVNLVQERGGEAGEATRVELATSLIVRDSTAPPAG
ncbi:LacI family DNA-binding transcriptional regulator [Asanoa sp. NPDC049573]|uniref:LacI family DNA-binding transcriptional regulator n=1 Tax=Asanoa sp. NPDC049573 TaxID=3155396 RepID=UPI00342B08A9